MGVQFTERLKKMQQNFDIGKSKRSGNDFRFPEGIFRWQVNSASMFEASTSKHLYVKVENLCLDGDAQGQTKTQLFDLDSENGFSMVCRWIENMGYEIPAQAEQIEDVLPEIVNALPIFQGTIKNKGEYQNLWFNRLIETQGFPEVGTHAPKPQPTKAVEMKTAETVDEQTGEVGGEVPVDQPKRRGRPPKSAAPAPEVRKSARISANPADAITTEALFKFAKEQEFDVTAETPREELIDTIKGEAFNKNLLKPDEIALLEAIGGQAIVPQE
jgi:hypothetical protein